MRNFLILAGVALFLGCSNPSQPQIAAASLAPPFLDEVADSWAEEQDHNVSLNIDGRVELSFSIEDLWTEPAYLQQIHRDTLYLMLGLVEEISGHRFSLNIQDPKIKSIKVAQRYETSLTIMDEGPHVDLTDWKHYLSDWQELSVVNGHFRSLAYRPQDYEKFPEVSKNEILEAVQDRVNHQQKWVNLAKNCKDPYSYPCGVSISRYFLKLTVEDGSDTPDEHIVVFEVPMGC